MSVRMPRGHDRATVARQRDACATPRRSRRSTLRSEVSRAPDPPADALPRSARRGVRICAHPGLVVSVGPPDREARSPPVCKVKAVVQCRRISSWRRCELDGDWLAAGQALELHLPHAALLERREELSCPSLIVELQALEPETRRVLSCPCPGSHSVENGERFRVGHVC